MARVSAAHELLHDLFLTGLGYAEYGNLIARIEEGALHCYRHQQLAAYRRGFK